MVNQNPNLTSLIQLEFDSINLRKNDGKNSVEEMIKSNRINPDTHPIMHEYFSTKKFHEIWME